MSGPNPGPGRRRVPFANSADLGLALFCRFRYGYPWKLTNRPMTRLTTVMRGIAILAIVALGATWAASPAGCPAECPANSPASSPHQSPCCPHHASNPTPQRDCTQAGCILSDAMPLTSVGLLDNEQGAAPLTDPLPVSGPWIGGRQPSGSSLGIFASQPPHANGLSQLTVVLRI